jgi:hypothetical protein
VFCAFGIDIWMQNQFPRGQCLGAFRVFDLQHSIGSYVHQEAIHLAVDAELRDVIGPLF